MFTPELTEKATALQEGGGSAVARVLGVPAPSVDKWRRQGAIGNAEARARRYRLARVRRKAPFVAAVERLHTLNG